MSRVCLRTLLLTWCHGNEASTGNCEEVVFYFPENSRDILRSKKSKTHASGVRQTDGQNCCIFIARQHCYADER